MKMKKSIILSLIMSFVFVVNIKAQELKNTKEFYKTTTNLLTAINSFESLNEGNLDNEKGVKIIEKNLNNIKSVFDLVKEKYSKDEDFKEYELWVLTINKSLELFKENEPSYSLACSLIKMNIYDFVNGKY